jgi:uncharacterized protein (UPF0264 family)
VCAFVAERGGAAFLLDTWAKDGSTLLERMAVAEVAELCRRCRSAGVGVALAGSLGLAQMAALREARPDWFAVRGAVCRGGERGAALDPEAVRFLARWLKAAA